MRSSYYSQEKNVFLLNKSIPYVYLHVRPPCCEKLAKKFDLEL